MSLRTETRTATRDPGSHPGAYPPALTPGAASRAPAAPLLPQPKRRRRPLLLAAGAVLVVLGGLGAYTLATGAGHRVAVVALAADVPWGQAITATDLIEAQIATDPALHPLAWADRGSAVGHLASTDLHAGALLTDGDIMAGKLPAVGQALVGVAVKPGLLPATGLVARQRVWIVHTDSSDQAAAAAVGGQTTDPVRAVVLTAGAPDASGGRTVDVLVASTDAATVADWSAAGTAAIILVSGR